MSDFADNKFYPSAERIWLCIRLNKWEMFWHYFENHGNVAECVRKLCTNFKKCSYVRYHVKKVKETGILIDKPKREKPKTVRTPENIAAVAESVCEAPSTSIHRHSQQLNISETSLKRILHKDLGMTPHKVQLVQFSWSQLTIQFYRLTEDANFGKKNHLFRSS